MISHKMVDTVVHKDFHKVDMGHRIGMVHMVDKELRKVDKTHMAHMYYMDLCWDLHMGPYKDFHMADMVHMY